MVTAPVAGGASRLGPADRLRPPRPSAAAWAQPLGVGGSLGPSSHTRGRHSPFSARGPPGSDRRPRCPSLALAACAPWMLVHGWRSPVATALSIATVGCRRSGARACLPWAGPVTCRLPAAVLYSRCPLLAPGAWESVNPRRPPRPSRLPARGRSPSARRSGASSHTAPATRRSRPTGYRPPIAARGARCSLPRSARRGCLFTAPADGDRLVLAAPFAVTRVAGRPVCRHSGCRPPRLPSLGLLAAPFAVTRAAGRPVCRHSGCRPPRLPSLALPAARAAGRPLRRHSRCRPLGLRPWQPALPIGQRPPYGPMTAASCLQAASACVCGGAFMPAAAPHARGGPPAGGERSCPTATAHVPG
jgi:hypothetical protein